MDQMTRNNELTLLPLHDGGWEASLTFYETSHQPNTQQANDPHITTTTKYPESVTVSVTHQGTPTETLAKLNQVATELTLWKWNDQ